MASTAAATGAPQDIGARADAESVQVLVINSAGAYLPAFVAIDAATRATVQQHFERPVQWLYESFDVLRFGRSIAPEMADILARKYAGTRIDAVVVVAEPALDFYLAHRARLWPQAPVVFHSVREASLPALARSPGVQGVPVRADYAQTARIALALQPNARRLVVIAGTSEYDAAELREALAALQPLAGLLEIEPLVGLPPPAMARRLSHEDSRTIVLYTTVFRDAQGRIHTPRDVLATLAEASAVPLFGIHETQMGHGLTAGAIESFTERGVNVGRLIAQALRSGASAAGTVVAATPSRCVADARRLKRFGLDAAALPAECDVLYAEVPFLRRYWWQSLLVAAALAGQTLLIGALLAQLRRRRRAETTLQTQRAQLLHASRLAVAGELTASIAHEINQPLGAILSNADAAELLLRSGRMSDQVLLDILADIRRDDLRASEVIRRLRALLAKHDVDLQPMSLNGTVEAGAAILRAEAARRGAAIEVALQARHDMVLGDPVQIQQVILNLVLNAFDAVGDLPAERRRVVLETADVAGGVRLSARDFGHGIAPADFPRLFDPFYSTKRTGMGLGLSIARSIVESHGGSIAAIQHGDGAEFQVTLPRAPLAERAVATSIVPA